MQYNFRQAVNFTFEEKKDEKGHRLSQSRRSILFPLGVNEVSEEVEQHPFFSKMVESGMISEPDPNQVPKESQEERKKRLLDRLAKKPAPVAPVSSPQGEAQAEDKSEESSKKKLKR